MNDTAHVPDELQAVLKEYSKLQGEERAIRERKSELQALLAAHMQSLNAAEWLPTVDGQLYKVRYRKSVRVDYDEALLSERLGDRYAALLRPDIKKMRAQLDALEPHLKDALDLIGSPDPGKVKAAIESGLASTEEFKGAFEKKETVQVSVTRLHVDPQSAPS